MKQQDDRDMTTTAQTHFATAIRLLQEDNWDKALDSLQLAAELKEQLDTVDRVHLLIALGLAHVATGDYESARNAFTTAKQFPPSPYLPDKFIAKLDIGMESSPPMPSIMAKGRPVTMELHFLKNVITTAALRQVPTGDDMINKSVEDVSNAILRSVSDQPEVEKPKRRWWQFWR